VSAHNGIVSLRVSGGEAVFYDLGFSLRNVASLLLRERRWEHLVQFYEAGWLSPGVQNVRLKMLLPTLLGLLEYQNIDHVMDLTRRLFSALILDSGTCTVLQRPTDSPRAKQSPSPAEFQKRCRFMRELIHLGYCPTDDELMQTVMFSSPLIYRHILFTELFAPTVGPLRARAVTHLEELVGGPGYSRDYLSLARISAQAVVVLVDSLREEVMINEDLLRGLMALWWRANYTSGRQGFSWENQADVIPRTWAGKLFIQGYLDFIPAETSRSPGGENDIAKARALLLARESE
jgi:hypothetical protein